MSSKGKGAGASVVGELFRFGLYKPNQGRLVRQATFIAVSLIVAFGCFSLSGGLLGAMDQPVRVGVPLVLWVVSSWAAFRAVNAPRFAEFLISVESELDKVVWPGQKQVLQSTVVVIVTMLFLGVFLALVDIVWKWLFSVIGFIDY